MYPGSWPTENTVDIPIRACFLREMGITPKFRSVIQCDMSKKDAEDTAGGLWNPYDP